jgi:ribonuclease PH
LAGHARVIEKTRATHDLGGCDVLQADGERAPPRSAPAWRSYRLPKIRWEKNSMLPMQLVAAVSAGILDGQAIADLNYEEDKLVAVDFNVSQRGAFVNAGFWREATFQCNWINACTGAKHRRIDRRQRLVLARLMVTPRRADDFWIVNVCVQTPS